MSTMQETLVIAEAGVNHNGDLQLAKKLVDAASDAGADVVKFQTFKSNQLVTDYAKQATYQTIQASSGARRGMQYTALEKGARVAGKRAQGAVCGTPLRLASLNDAPRTRRHADRDGRPARSRSRLVVVCRPESVRIEQ